MIATRLHKSAYKAEPKRIIVRRSVQQSQTECLDNFAKETSIETKTIWMSMLLIIAFPKDIHLLILFIKKCAVIVKGKC